MLKPRRYIVPHRRPNRTEDFVFYAHELRRLPDREREILRLRVGLAGGREHTLTEVAMRFGIGRERVRQIQAAALLACRLQRQAADNGRRRGMRINASNPLLPKFPGQNRPTDRKRMDAAGSSDAEGQPLVRVLRLDRRGQEQLTAVLEEFVARVEELERESADRMAGEWPPSKPIKVALEAFAFTVPSPPQKARKRA